MQSLQEAAMRVIARKGIAGATMQDIAEEAGVAKGTIYLYFKDRDELVDTTFENAINQLHERIDSSMEVHATFEGKFRAALKTLLAFFRDNREFFRLYASQRFPEGSADQQRRQKRHCDRYRDRIRNMGTLLGEAMDRGEIRRTDPDRLALFITEGTNAIVIERVMEENPPSEEQDVDLIVDAVLDGIRAARSEE